MQLINATRMTAGFTMGVEPSGRESLVIAVKGTFLIPEESGRPLRLHDEQVPLVMADVFFGEPGLSAPKYEVDFAARKHRCDIVLNATAYAPNGRPARRVEVAVQVGQWLKSFAVVGDRSWEVGGAGIGASTAVPFTAMPVSYDRAFGGVDNQHEDPAMHAAFARNPSGRGFHRHTRRDWIDGAPLPNTEESDKPVTWIDGGYLPMSFGSIGRHWEPRVQYAGTYDQHWKDAIFPFLPEDFDERYYQTAPEDQQFPLPVGEQLVRLVNLTADGDRSFLLPHFEAPIHVFPQQGARENLIAQADTVVIEPDESRVTITWRATRPLKKDIFEVAQILVGRKGSEWWQKREEVAFPIPIVVESLAGPEPEEELTE